MQFILLNSSKLYVKFSGKYFFFYKRDHLNKITSGLLSSRFSLKDKSLVRASDNNFNLRLIARLSASAFLISLCNCLASANMTNHLN